ncbi:MAG: hypothetical protein NVS4B11_16950 [Ktedonobacteraceae bacterium]
MDKIKVLFLAANPLGTSRLALDEEMRLITEKVYATEHREQLDLVSAWAVRPDDLLQSLNRYRPQIVHFGGHGMATGELQLVGSDGSPRPVSPKALTAVFKALKDNIRLVILNACYSKIQAEAIRQEIECVVGMNAAIGDEAARIFAASFYRAIGFGRSVQEAFEQGQTALLLEGIAEEQTPELLVRVGSDPASIVLVRPELSDPTTVSRKTYNTLLPPNIVAQSSHVSTQEQGLNLFFSYAHEDKALRDELAKHLTILKRQGLIRDWYDQEIYAGEDRQEEVWAHLDAAHIIVLLISPDYIASDDLYRGQLARALVRHRTGKARVVPIILRDTEGWEQTDFGKLLALPRERKPLTAWKNRDAAFSSVAKDIRGLVEGLKGA